MIKHFPAGEEDPDELAVPPGGPGFGGSGPEPPILLELIRVLRVYGRAYLLLILIAAAVALVLAFVLPPRFKATASIFSVGSGLPKGSLGRLAQLANIDPGRDELPAETLCTILRSRRISDVILDGKFERWPEDSAALPFKNVLTGKAPGKEPSRDLLYRRLARATRFTLDPETRIVTVAVETRYPHLSAAVANAYIDAVIRYTTEEHQARTRLLAGVVARRTDEVRAEILASEQGLHRFIAANQNYATSTDPDIRIEQLRLERDLELKTRVLMDLVANHEVALLEQRNEAPFIQVIDRGTSPTLRSWPKRRLLVGGVAAGAAAIGFVLMLVADHLRIRSPRDVRALAA